uniref:Uncharacterized protein n=1 Tax=Tetraselmis sp. GSL018 TaxID=582737 RepID=A0A061SG46_9CHLO
MQLCRASTKFVDTRKNVGRRFPRYLTHPSVSKFFALLYRYFPLRGPPLSEAQFGM